MGGKTRENETEEGDELSTQPWAPESEERGGRGIEIGTAWKSTGVAFRCNLSGMSTVAAAVASTAAAAAIDPWITRAPAPPPIHNLRIQILSIRPLQHSPLLPQSQSSNPALHQQSLQKSQFFLSISFHNRLLAFTPRTTSREMKLIEHAVRPLSATEPASHHHKLTKKAVDKPSKRRYISLCLLIPLDLSV